MRSMYGISIKPILFKPRSGEIDLVMGAAHHYYTLPYNNRYLS